MSISAITFDFWYTLYTDLPPCSIAKEKGRASLIAELAERCGRTVSEEEIAASTAVADERFGRAWLEQRAMPAVHRLEILLADLEVPASRQQVERITQQIEELALECPPEPTPGTPDVLQQLSSHFRLALLSDTGYTPGRVIRKILERDGLLHFFSATVFSDEIGRCKPNPLVFMRVLASLHVKPEEALHVGDIVRTDVEGALGVGMKAVLLRTAQNEGDTLPPGASGEIGSLAELPALVL